MLRTELISGPELFEKLEGAWKALVSDSATATPFQTFEWQSTWWQHFGGYRRPLALGVYEGGDLIGLYPLVESLGLWKALRPMGIGPSDYLHPLALRDRDGDVAEEIVRFLSAYTGADLIDLHQIRETRAMAEHAAGASLDQAVCLTLDLPDTYEEYLGKLSKSLRYDVRKLDKDLFSRGRASIETIGPGDTDRGLDVLFEQHRLRWKKRGLPGAFLGRSPAFHRHWANQAAGNGWLWLSVLVLDGGPVGAIYGMTLGQTVYYYQAGFDPAQASVSPGTLLVASTVRRAIEEEKRHFDFMRGDEPYKRRWKPQHVARNLRFLKPMNAHLGQMGASWNLAGSRVESRVRARLEGKGLL